MSQLPPVFRLTARQKEILFRYARGDTLEEIGDVLGISQQTVSNHLYQVAKKLDARNPREAAWLSRHYLEQEFKE